MTTTIFVWDELNDNVLFETDENNNVQVAYTHRPEKFGKVLYHKAGPRHTYYHYDNNGSTRNLTGDAGTVIKTYDFSGFGELVFSSGTGSTPFAYKGAAGYYTNPVTNDIYVRARTYEPTTGRWLSKDPLGFVDGPNLYGAYFVPLSSDPFGTICVKRPTSVDDEPNDEDEPCGRELSDLDRKLYAFCYGCCIHLTPKDPTEICNLCKYLPEDYIIRRLCKWICKQAKDLLPPDLPVDGVKPWLCRKMCCMQLETKLPGDACIAEAYKPSDSNWGIDEHDLQVCQDCCDRVYGANSGICRKQCFNYWVLWKDWEPSIE